MKPFLALVDLQVDYLCEPGLEPHRSTVIGGAAELLRAARERGWAVCHVWTTARRDPDDRMPHWKSARRWNCLDGTAGHAPPPKLAPLAGEKRVHKTGFNPFREPQFAEWIRANAFD